MGLDAFRRRKVLASDSLRGEKPASAYRASSNRSSAPMLRVYSCLTSQHDWRLVLLAGAVCFLTSVAALNLFHRACATTGGTRALWLVTAGAATGYGVWATHFIAMLAYSAGVPLGYDLGLTVVSLLAAAA